MSTNGRSSLSRRAVLAGLGAVGVAACAPANGRPDLVQPPATTSTLPRFGQQLMSPADDRIFSTAPDAAAIDRSIVATTVPATIEVFDEPGGDVIHTMTNPTPTNGPLVFLTLSNTPEWHEVLLPIRPNGNSGWVRNADVSLAAHNYRIRVDLPDFRLRVFESGEPIFDAVAGVARDNAPTPGGTYYLTELLAPTVPDTIYGTFAYGLSGFSETFETFNGGPGQLGIHGTNEPETLGTAVSSGCIRLHNDDVGRLVEFLPLGVPVEVS
ncbi:MAG: L,D-transpeptidase [Acidimicrobiales bacterium]